MGYALEWEVSFENIVLLGKLQTHTSCGKLLITPLSLINWACHWKERKRAQYALIISGYRGFSSSCCLSFTFVDSIHWLIVNIYWWQIFSHCVVWDELRRTNVDQQFAMFQRNIANCCPTFLRNATQLGGWCRLFQAPPTATFIIWSLVLIS